MKILVTGATGFIGSTLCLKLAESGFKVHAFGRNVLSCKYLKHRNILLFKGDIQDKSAIQKAALGCSQAYHLAALVKAQVNNTEDYFNCNVKGTINVMEACLKAQMQRVIFTSTCGTFPPSGDDFVNNEDSIRVPVFFSDYAASKYKAETLALEYIKKGLEVVVVSPTRVYGPGPLNDSNAITKLIKLYLKGKWRIIPGRGVAFGNYAFIDDVVEGHINAMKFGKSGENYLLGGENKSIKDLISTIELETGLSRWMMSINLKLIMFLIKVQELFFKLMKKSPLITASWAERIGKSSAFSNDKAIKNLNYKITPFTEGIRKTISWLEEEYSR